MCRALGQSQRRRSEDPESRVAAALTQREAANKRFVFEQFWRPEHAHLPAMQRMWREGYQCVLSGALVLVFVVGHRQPFRLPLCLSRDSLVELVRQAQLLKPNDPASVQVLQ